MNKAWITDTIAEQLGYVNVKNPTYGAAGDGTTDDTAAIAAAITAAGADGAIYIPDGQYRITSSLNLLDGQRMVGAGHKQAIFLARGITGSLLKLNPSGGEFNGNTIENLGFAWSSGAGNTYFIETVVQANYTTNFVIRDCQFDSTGGSLTAAIRLCNIVSGAVEDVEIFGSYSTASIDVAATSDGNSFGNTTLRFKKVYTNASGTCPYGIAFQGLSGKLNTGMTLDDCVLQNHTTAALLSEWTYALVLTNFYAENVPRIAQFGTYSTSKPTKYLTINGLQVYPVNNTQKGILLDYVDGAVIQNVRNLENLTNANWLEYGRAADVVITGGGYATGSNSILDHVRRNANADASNGVVIISGGTRNNDYSLNAAPSITMRDTSLTGHTHRTMRVTSSGGWTSAAWTPTST